MNVHRLSRTFMTALLVGALGAAASAGCSAADGTGNLLAGQACDAFTIDLDPRCVCCSEQSGNCLSGVSPCAPKDASPTCGSRCPDGLECVTVNGQEVCGVESTCEGPTQQSCGNCGVMNRTCTDGVWSDWSACEAEGECSPGLVESCGPGQERTCDASCTWGACVAECTPDEKDTQPCGNCGTTTRTCDATGAWGAFEGCTGEGECSPSWTQACSGGTQTCGDDCFWGPCLECQPGQTETQGCGFCGTETRQCSAAGAWEAFGACENAGSCTPGTVEVCSGGARMCLPSCEWGTCAVEVCTPGQFESRPCSSGCGTETRTCLGDGTWEAWSGCGGVGACTPGTYQACSGGYQVCDGSCSWSSCYGALCVPGTTATVACGLCGSGTATCNGFGTYDPPPSCGGEGPCSPGTSQGCGAGGVQACDASCQWGTCLPVECSSGAAEYEVCGDCGTRSRVCVNQRWAAWTGCSGQGVCTPSATSACGTGGTMTCQSDCQWGQCLGQTCTGSYIQSCGVCGVQTRTCDNGTWSSFSGCFGERDCIPGNTRACAGGTETCGFDCYWGACQ